MFYILLYKNTFVIPKFLILKRPPSCLRIQIVLVCKMSFVHIGILLIVILIFFVLAKYGQYFCQQCISIHHEKPSSFLSIIVLNYKRPHNLRKLVPILHEYEYVQEIVIVNGIKNNIVDFPSLYKVKQYEHDNTIGGAIRFYAPTEFDHILLLDDDHVPSERYVCTALTALEKDPNGLFGNTHRRCTQRYDMCWYPFFGANMVLTQCMFVHRNVLDLILINFNRYIPLMIQTRGNGEDIVFNYLYRSLFTRNPIRIYPLGHVKTLDEDSSSYRGNTNHFKIRHEICHLLYTNPTM